jgi:hypothetical protein
MEDWMRSMQHDAALITVARHEKLGKELHDWEIAEKAKQVRYTRHAQYGMDGCDPETCQNKEHWCYEFDGPGPRIMLDWVPTAMALIEKHGLQKAYEEVLRERTAFFEVFRGGRQPTIEELKAIMKKE